jgi:hypothetical protein
VIPGVPGLFETLTEHQPALADVNHLTLGRWEIDLRLARLWEARLPDPGQQPVQLTPAMINMIAPYAAWPQLQSPTPLAKALHRQAAIAAARLTGLLADYSTVHNTLPATKTVISGQPSVVSSLSTAIEQLAGLGDGLTPAGDDYLVGVMAALWLKGKVNWLPQMAAIAAPRTTRLSAAFLQAAGRGEFSQPWHYLVQALAAADTAALEKAMAELTAVGASSGQAGLAGFATTILSHNITA